MRRIHLTLLVVALGVVSAVLNLGRPLRVVQGAPPWQYRLTKTEADRDHARVLTAADRAATFTFAPGTLPADRDAFLSAIGSGIRPDAARLVDMVDGLVNVQFAPETGDALGHAATRQDGRFDLVLDMAALMRETGPRGLRQASMHELGHIVDFALLTPEVEARLDAQIPRGYQCPPGSQISGCAPREERFAETFAKWSTGDIGNGLYAGYAVMPPTISFDRWGAPLSELARR